MIELHALQKDFAGTPAIRALSLRIEPGELLVLLGASGSGKSTLLKLINGLLRPDQGTVQFQGQDIRQLAPEDLRRRMGYVIQSVGLFPHWTVARNVATVPHLLRWSAARVAARVDELLALLGLEPTVYRSRYPHQLSGGQQQRVGVARALAADPEVLLMDEPFGALDPLTRQSLQQALTQIHCSSGKTIVLVTHDIDEALRLATRIVLLDQGRIVQAGTPLQLLAQPASAAVGDFMGRSDVGLKLLGLLRVAQRMRPVNVLDRAAAVTQAVIRQDSSANLPPATSQAWPQATAAGPTLAPGATLREALSVLVMAQAPHLPVVDAQGRVVGELHFADLSGRPP